MSIRFYSINSGTRILHSAVEAKKKLITRILWQTRCFSIKNSSYNPKPPLTKYHRAIRTNEENTNKSVSSEGSRQISVQQLLDNLRSPKMTRWEFQHNLKEACTLKLSYQKLPPDVLISIQHHVKRMEVSSIIPVVYSLSRIGFTTRNLNPETQQFILIMCGNALGKGEVKVQMLASVLYSLSSMNFVHSQLEESTLEAIKKALTQVLSKDHIGSTFNYIQQLGFLQFKWSRLPDSIRELWEDGMEEGMHVMLPFQLQKLIFGLNLMDAKCDDLRSTTRQAILKALANMESIPMDLQQLIFNGLATMEFPWSSLTTTLIGKAEQSFIASIKLKEVYALPNLIKMHVNYKLMSPYLREFFSHEYIYLVRPENVSKSLHSLSNMGFYWNNLSKSSQQELLSKLEVGLPKLTKTDSFFAMQGLLGLQPLYHELPSFIHESISIYLLDKLVNGSTDGISTTLNCMGKMGMKYSELSEEIKELIQQFLVKHLPTMSGIRVAISLSGLSEMNMQFTDLRDDVAFTLHEVVISLKESCAEIEISPSLVPLWRSLEKLFDFDEKTG